jgi:hypothetical protein
MKTCPRCKRALPRGKFHKDNSSSDGLQTYCKRCVKEYQTANRKRINQQKFKYTHGVGLIYKNFLLAAQDWHCPICGKIIEPNSSDACLDHEHETGKIRGVLCRGCNLYIGKYGDNIIGVSKGIMANTENELLPNAYGYLLNAF